MCKRILSRVSKLPTGPEWERWGEMHFKDQGRILERERGSMPQWQWIRTGRRLTILAMKRVGRGRRWRLRARGWTMYNRAQSYRRLRYHNRVSVMQRGKAQGQAEQRWVRAGWRGRRGPGYRWWRCSGPCAGAPVVVAGPKSPCECDERKDGVGVRSRAEEEGAVYTSVSPSLHRSPRPVCTFSLLMGGGFAWPASSVVNNEVGLRTRLHL